MEFWPSLSSCSISKRSQSKADKGKGRAGSGETWSIYPVIDHGAQSAATLVKVGDELEWKTVHSTRKGSLLVQGEPCKVYPCMRPKEVTNVNASLRQRAERGAKFLRTYHPDVDIPFEIIKDVLEEDEKARKPHDRFDPFEGNTFSATFCFDSVKKKAIALAFPTGVLGNELNVSPATIRPNSVLFQPRTCPAWTFETPIRQIVTSSPAVNMEEKTGYNLAVRAYGQVSIFDIKNHVFASPESMKPPFALSEVASIRPHDLQSSAGRGIVDMSFCCSDSKKLFFVTERGAGYKCSWEEGQKIIQRIFDEPLKDNRNFWRILGDQTTHGGIVASDKAVRTFDTRAFGTSMDILGYDDGRNLITSICPTQIEHLFCVSTTSQIIWIDDRYPKQPLLGWKHHRAFDRTLSVQTIDFDNTSLAFLGSSKNSHVSVISVGKLHNGPLQCQMPPRALPSVLCEAPITGRTLVRHPGIPRGSFSLLELSSQGSVHHQDLRYVTDASTVSPGREHVKSRFDFQWSEEVRELEKREKELKPNYGKLAGREIAKVDLSELYKALFGEEAQNARADAEEANAGEVYDTLEKMPSFWQRSDTGEEHIRTLFDVAFGSGSEPLHLARADFLTGTVLDSARGYRARKQGRIPVEEVAKKAGWHMDIRPILHRISPEVFKYTSSGDADKQFEVYPVRRDEEIPVANRRETEAREQLAVDLALASHVFSATPIRNPTLQTVASGAADESEEAQETEAATLLTQETEKLSLTGKEPPQVSFGFLRPVLRGRKERLASKVAEASDKQAGDETVLEDGEVAKMPLGVRLLLSEWTIGDDPDTYEYVDPYDLDLSAFEGGSRSIRDQTQAGRRRQQQQQRQRDTPEEEDSWPIQTMQQAPPTIVAARTLKEKEKEMRAQAQASQPSRTGVRVQSQQEQFQSGVLQTEAESQGDGSQAMPAIANTQVEPGRFGGRPGVITAKKPVKKRLGGF